MGSVLNVQPHLDRVDVLIQVDDENTVIPRNSRLFANQSGLIAEPLVDIMPQHPIPTYTASPLADTCKSAPASSLMSYPPLLCFTNISCQGSRQRPIVPVMGLITVVLCLVTNCATVLLQVLGCSVLMQLFRHSSYCGLSLA